MALEESYGIENAEVSWIGLPGDSPAVGESFQAHENFVLTSVRLPLVRAYGSEGGTCVVKLYAHSGTFGSTGVPTGSPLATSDAVSLSTIPSMGGGWETAVGQWIASATESSCTQFTFSTPYTLVNGTAYFIILEYTVDNYLLWIADNTSPASPGNIVDYYGGAWGYSYYSYADLIFYVYGTPVSSGTNLQINIGDTWKTVESVQINVGDTWKTVTGISLNVGDTWKTVF